MKYCVTASHHLNFYPGTMNETPPDYERVLVSDPMDEEQARLTELHWRAAVRSPGWKFAMVAASPVEPSRDGGAGEGAGR